jgi:RHS repeat-associated protein
LFTSYAQNYPAHSIKSRTTVDKLTGITNKTEYAYTSTDHGNPYKITETQGSLITETANTWTAKNSTYKNRIAQQTVTKKGIGTTFSETKKFEYDSQARLTQRIDYSGHPQAVTTDYTNYDNFGHPQTVTATATNCPTVATSSIFDGTGRFETIHTDALGHNSSAKYDSKTGILLETTDIAGLKTVYQYDGFQKLLQKTTPFDNINYSTTWDISGNNVYKTAVMSQISGTQTRWYNVAGMETKTQSPGFSGTVVSEKEYNYKGQLYRSWLPGYGSRSSQYIEYEYDSYGRIAAEINIGRYTDYYYYGLETTVNFPDGSERVSVLNESGLLQSSIDEAGNSVTYSYNSLGKPEIVTSNGIATHIRYDGRGFQRMLKDVNMADSIRYVYDAYGQLTSQTNARGQTTSFQYDAAGRMTQETRPETTFTYQYALSGNGIGQIQTIREGTNTVQSYTYTPWSQVESVTENIDNAGYTTAYNYDKHGQLQQKLTPSGFRIGYQYTNGILTAMRNVDVNSLLWQADAANALGQITESTLGNGLKRVSGYDTYHLPNQIALKDGTTFIDRVNYDFDPYIGNLTQRNDITNGRNEVFDYDVLNRLASVSLNGSSSNTVAYAANGNIQSKSDVGTYQYAGGNHAVSGITGKASSYSPAAVDIANTSYNRASSVIQQGSVVRKLEFQYSPDMQRKQSRYYENNVLQKTVYYIGNYEKEATSSGSTKEYDYIYTPEGLSAIAVKTNGTRSLYYVNTDHLGSIRTVTTESKGIQTRYYYDAWGKQTLVSGTSITNRGYLAQEHLNEFGLINLNARLYDPVLARFLGMDPYVQMPDYTQAFNRYAYGFNNPLKYIDPSGEMSKFWKRFFSIVTGIEVVAVQYATTAYVTGLFSDGWSEANRRAELSWKISEGTFEYDKNEKTSSPFWQVLSRIMWQGGNTIIGNLLAQTYNNAGKVDDVGYFHGATVLSSPMMSNGRAVSVGGYIILGRADFRLDYDNATLMHEYGHFLQSRDWGSILGPPIMATSLFSTMGVRHGNSHADTCTETDANARSLSYFLKLGKLSTDGSNSTESVNYTNFIREYSNIRYRDDIMIWGLFGINTWFK